MGIITSIAISTNCFGACTEEEVPDKDYDFLIKQEEQKDGLDVYKPQSTITYCNQIKCPLCKFSMPNEDRNKLQNILSNGGEKLLDSIIRDYNREVDSFDKLDNIDSLEAIYKKMEEITKAIEENRFYKHTCTRNEICKRTQNQDIYIDLWANSPQEKMEKGLKVDFKKLKTDENYKNKYLSDRKIAYEKHIKMKRKREIENKYRSKFEALTFQKESYMYEAVTRNIRSIYETHMKLEARKGPNEIHSDFDASNRWHIEKGSFNYSGTKKKLLRFIENLTGQNIDDSVQMDHKEYKEFQKYILERDPDYKELINIK